jgi:hypothetical protein
MTSVATKNYRIPALDFTKGALVLVMVLYHWINYFFGVHDNRYLRFLTPSFIFITGFLISNVYLSKYGAADPKLPKRLAVRGLKILAVFALLNVTRTLLVRGPVVGQSSDYPWTQRLLDIYVTGSGVGGGQAKAVAFFILVPISYLLILSALLIFAVRFYRYTFHVVFLLFLVAIAVLGYQDIQSPNLELLTMGLLGVIAGYAPIEKVDHFVRHPYLLVAAYLLYLAAITVWSVPFALQIAGVCLSLMIIYLLGQGNGEPGRVRASILLLGKYSLVGYIAQIAILQVLRLGLNRISSEAVVLASSFVLAFALTIASVAVLDRTRAQSATMDKLYKAVFA